MQLWSQHAISQLGALLYPPIEHEPAQCGGTMWTGEKYPNFSKLIFTIKSRFAVCDSIFLVGLMVQVLRAG